MIKPLGDRVAIKVDDIENTTESGIILSLNSQEKPQKGSIVAIGNKVEELKEGDSVIFSKYAGAEVKENGSDYLILREADVLAIIQ